MAQFNAADFLVHAQARGEFADKNAVEGTRTRTYAELSDDVARLAANLRGLGLHRDDRVLCFMVDDVEFLTTVVAAFHAGLVAVPISTMYNGHELSEILIDSGARVVVGSAEFTDAVNEAVALAPEVEHLVTSGGMQADVPDRINVVDWESLLDEPATPMAQPEDTSEDAWALWLYTSGTTGKPKAAMHRHANIRHVYQTYGKQVLRITSDDRCLSVAKIFFAYGIGNSVFFPLAAGATTILEPRRPTPAVFAERTRTAKPTLFFGVPTFYNGMIHSDVADADFASVRLGVSAGEPLPAALQEKILARFGFEILDGLGSTEALHIFLSNDPDDIRHGTTGKPVPGWDVEVRDEAGAVCDVDVPGELFIRGESLALGYWRRTDAQRSVFLGGWMRTGDTYTRDADGIFHCMGRSNDLLKAGGIWVTPSEVEARLLAHPSVMEAAVVGAEDEAGLVKPVAAVVLTDDAAPVTSAELIAWCREGLASFKAPRAVRILDDLPKTATGKLQRFRVREQLSDSLTTPDSELEGANR
ncbi:benzoate-CoA ligase family protein [Gordonia hydrophobica]|uniref:Benzoate-CoA ligase family protein n=1 Tax=Gordonia hydrophobica TaxID=40516 RepID=A0ABZ2TZ08_9ACTN|nr:benzoate-CoA ligase family protein [Gordonia hydrophobica]MBM7366561.1 benzoate-CoA ligase [Gordonia hydrophobica]